MSVDECISAEELAQLFHRYHGVLTGCFDGRTATAPWDQVDSHQRRLLVATARLVLSDLAAKQHAGEAEETAQALDAIAATEETATTSDAVDAHPEPSNSPAHSRYYAKPGHAEWGC